MMTQKWKSQQNYPHVKNTNDSISCYFTKQTNKAYSVPPELSCSVNLSHSESVMSLWASAWVSLHLKHSKEPSLLPGHFGLSFRVCQATLSSAWPPLPLMQSALPLWWDFWSSTSESGEILHPEDILQCLGTLLVVTTWKVVPLVWSG